MQVKKFEAATIQEALDTIKRELGPEAIILQTKKNKRGFGLMSKGSVEVTAAVSDRALQKKQFVETRLPEPGREAVKKMNAQRQAEFYDKYADARASAPKAPRQESAPIDRLMNAGTSSGSSDRVEVSRSASAPKKNAAPAQARQSYSPAPATAATPSAANTKITATRYVDIDAEEVDSKPNRTAAAATVGRPSVEEEVRYLKRMIEEMKNVQDSREMTGSGAQALMNAPGQAGQSVMATPALQDAFEQLVINGLDKRYALSLIRQVGFELGAENAQNPEAVLEQLAAEIMRNTEVLSPLETIQPNQNGQPAIIALVGPTGVGKTTTVAKIASEALLRRNLKVGLINLDSYKIAAFDQLGTYAKILNVPFRSVSSEDELRTAVRDFHMLDLVLIDTTGRSQRDPDSLRGTLDTLSGVPGIVSQLVLSATTRDNELYDMASRFSVFRPQGIVLSKLDEASIYGSIYNVSQKTKLPLLHFTTGQRVPEDIEEATRERVAALILDLS